MVGGSVCLRAGMSRLTPGAHKARAQGGGEGKRILDELGRAGRQNCFNLFFTENPGAGPSGEVGHRQREAGRNGWWEAQCRCGALLKVRTSEPLRAHATVCFILAAGSGTNESVAHDETGNTTLTQGRGADLLTCGDVEANPGLEQRPAEETAEDTDMGLEVTSHSTEREV